MPEWRAGSFRINRPHEDGYLRVTACTSSVKEADRKKILLRAGSKQSDSLHSIFQKGIFVPRIFFPTRRDNICGWRLAVTRYDLPPRRLAFSGTAACSLFHMSPSNDTPAICSPGGPPHTSSAWGLPHCLQNGRRFEECDEQHPVCYFNSHLMDTLKKKLNCFTYSVFKAMTAIFGNYLYIFSHLIKTKPVYPRSSLKPKQQKIQRIPHQGTS